MTAFYRGISQQRQQQIKTAMTDCHLCPRNCHVNRSLGQKGFCGAPAEMIACRSALHFWEEPCLSGTQGSGTVFFAYCPLQCVYCQNYAISEGQNPPQSNLPTISPQRLAEVFLSRQEEKAHNINLVTPTHFVPQIAAALEIAKKQGLTIPIIYNTSSYEWTETLSMLDGLVDIYLPDLKYAAPQYSKRYSHAADYFTIATHAIDEMVRQVGNPIFNSEGMMRKGVIIRHLVLPGLTTDSKKILHTIYTRWYPKVWVSIMRQYTPLAIAADYPELQERISDAQYDEIVDYAADLGITQGFIQEGEAAADSFIPIFDGTGIF